MWPFSSARRKPEPTRLELDLGERMEKLERSIRDVRLDWDDMYEKFRLLYARAAKRIRESARLTEEETREDAPGPTISKGSPLDHPLGHRGPRITKGNY
jgi:hypothetical protein